jgi:hypothetical protein
VPVGLVSEDLKYLDLAPGLVRSLGKEIVQMGEELVG